MTARARRGSVDRPKPKPRGSAIGEEPAVAEAGVDFAAEFSVIVARWADGRQCSGTRPRTSIATASSAARRVPCSDRDRRQVPKRAQPTLRIAEALGHVGVLTVEFFASADGPVVNEIAPRVHNSGHWTIEGAVTSQFEQHIRAICGLPPGVTALTGARRDDGQPDRRRRRPLAGVARRARRRTCTSTARAKPAPAARWVMSRA